MNTINLNDVQTGYFFTEDVYLQGELFFLPKKVPILDYHIKLLKNWNINSMYTIGELKDLKSVAEDDTPEDLEAVFNSPDVSVTTLEDIDDLEEANETIKTVTDFRSIYKEWILTSIGFFNDIVTKKTIDKEKVVNFITDIKGHVKKNKNESLKMFGKQIEGIPYIHRKTIETTILSYILSESMQLGDFASSNLLFSTLFHDLGMLKVPKEILQKKGALTKEDLIEIQNHTIYGYKFLREVGYSAIISSGALQHHERIDGKG